MEARGLTDAASKLENKINEHATTLRTIATLLMALFTLYMGWFAFGGTTDPLSCLAKDDVGSNQIWT